MTNQHHTPGPWRVNDWSVKGWSIASNAGLHIASKRYETVLCGQDYRDEMLKNAHLIAAAPELLEALQQVYTRLELEESENPNGTYLCAAMRGTIGRAIKKAKGEID